MNKHSKRKVAIIGSGITGLSAAWLLSKNHDVTLFEKDDRLGGHSNTIDIETDAGTLPVDTGFIVYNPVNYPNLVNLFRHLDVDVSPTEMSFAVSMDNGELEYSGTGLKGLFAQKRNILRPKFIQMVRDIMRFYREAPELEATIYPDTSLRELLQRGGYSKSFIENHLLPMGAAIWSTPANRMLDYPAAAFLRFCRNHGLLQVKNRPQWHTVKGGSRQYVEKLTQAIDGTILTNRAVHQVRRLGGKVFITDWQGDQWQFDEVVFACHADQTMRMLADPRPEELQILSKFRFERNRAVLHTDPALMPANKKVWSSWNYLGRSTGTESGLSVTYWMNKLQHLPTKTPVQVTLNPVIEPEEKHIHASFLYDHPIFDQAAINSQTDLWGIQGRYQSWFCGAWCGYGFHEDGLQAGLLVAEKLGGENRPWTGNNLNSRIPVSQSFINSDPLLSDAPESGAA